jgi:DNA-binding response OmpR family regulator
VTDLRLLNGDCVELIIGIRAQDLDCPIIVAIGQVPREAEAETLEAGLDELLLKLLDLQELSAEVTRPLPSEEN